MVLFSLTVLSSGIDIWRMLVSRHTRSLRKYIPVTRTEFGQSGENVSTRIQHTMALFIIIMIIYGKHAKRFDAMITDLILLDESRPKTLRQILTSFITIN